MLNDLKKELIQNPDKIVELLEHYGFARIRVHRNYISFGRDEYSSGKSITLWLEDNDALNVKDWARNTYSDIISLIMREKSVTFLDVLNEIKSILGVTDFGYFEQKRSPWGGYFDKFHGRKKRQEIEIYPESILDQYSQHGNLRFLKDHIDLETQLDFGIRFDESQNTIIIPIRDQIGRLMGIKGRRNWDSDDPNFNKYIYVVPCLASQTLYGYYKNYPNLVNGTILIGEAEKFVLQAASYGYGNAVGLASGSISTKQVQMILECHPKEVILCHDQGYEEKALMRNLEMLSTYTRFTEMNVKYWLNNDFPHKASITDLGKEVFEKELKGDNIYDYS